MGDQRLPPIEQQPEPTSFDYVKAALKWQYNLIGLAGATAFALVSGTGLPLVLAAGLELIYISLVPQNSRFRRLVRSWRYADEKRRRDMQLRAMFLEIPPEMRSRYAEVDRICRAIRANYQRLSSTSQMLVQQVEQKLEGLMQSYLRLLHSAHLHREYLRTTKLDSIQREAAQIERSLESDTPKVQEINRKRIEILKKRVEKFEKIKDNCGVVDAQCAAIEDVLALIRDQSVTMRDPQEISDHLDGLMHDVEQTEDTVRQVEAIFELAAPDTGILSPLPSETPGQSSGPPRQRLRN